MDDNLKQAIAAHALAVYPEECCGLVADGRYFPCANTSPTPSDGFTISPEDWSLAEDVGPIQILVHSHPGAAAHPSEADLDACEAAGVPEWVIVSLGAQADGSVGIEDWYTFAPSGHVTPVEGVPFTHGTHDCYGLIRRWYLAEHHIRLPDFPRGNKWWDDGVSDLYTKGFPQAGFVSVGLLGFPVQRGDVLLMKVASRNNVPNHAAVYLGGDDIVHHLYGQLSRRDSLPRYREYVTHILRHKDFIK